MTWSALTAAEVLEEFNASERAAFDTAKGADNLGAIVTRVIERVRAAGEWGGADLGAAGTIPTGLKGEAIAIARWRYLLALPKNEKLQSPDRKAAHDDALRLLEAIAKGEISLGPRTTDADSNLPGQSGTITRLPMRTEPAA